MELAHLWEGIFESFGSCGTGRWIEVLICGHVCSWRYDVEELVSSENVLSNWWVQKDPGPPNALISQPSPC